MTVKREFKSVFFFNDTATTEIYTLSLHDALPICPRRPGRVPRQGSQRCLLHLPDAPEGGTAPGRRQGCLEADRKSTRLNSSHANISYAVFCLKKKKKYKSNLFSQPSSSSVIHTYI